jgi:methionyl-tRNA synthetase
MQYKNIITLIVCSEHKDLCKATASIMAQGRCDTHGKFGLYKKDLKIACPKCAYVRAVCQVCGKLLTKDDIDNWHEELGTPVPKGKSRVYL